MSGNKALERKESTPSLPDLVQLHSQYTARFERNGDKYQLRAGDQLYPKQYTFSQMKEARDQLSAILTQASNTCRTDLKKLKNECSISPNFYGSSAEIEDGNVFTADPDISLIPVAQSLFVSSDTTLDPADKVTITGLLNTIIKHPFIPPASTTLATGNEY